MLRAEPAPRVLTVTQLAALVRETLEGGVGRVWVAGEISNLRPAPSGHVYFTLKDEQSQLGAVLFRSAVQVAGAGREVAAGIEDLNRLGGLDVLIVGRGGGSLEDLWAFNEEVTARAIAASAIPVVSAVGHEVDFTIADFVADARAPTPTAAASLVVPDREEVAAGLARAEAALRRGLARRVAAARERVVGLERALGDPARRVRDLGQRIDDLAARMRRGLLRRLAWERREVTTLAARLARSGPAPGPPRAREPRAAAGERPRLALGLRPGRVRSLAQRLTEVEQRVEVLLKSEAGKLVLRPLETDEE